MWSGENCAWRVGRKGWIKLVGPRVVPARSGHKRFWAFWWFGHLCVFGRAANRDGSRSDLELAAALAGGRLGYLRPAKFV
jgi:hypothetical protein